MDQGLVLKIQQSDRYVYSDDQSVLVFQSEKRDTLGIIISNK